jgi:hypothetical protein
VSTSRNWRELEQQILKVIRTGVRPVAVAFLDTELAGVKKFEGTRPSGCSTILRFRPNEKKRRNRR